MPRDHITIPELIKELKVPPEKRTESVCKKMAGALYAFIKSIPEFKEGQHDISNFVTVCIQISKSLRRNIFFLGFHKMDALAVAKHVLLQTVDNRQTVFSQGFGADSAVFLSICFFLSI